MSVYYRLGSLVTALSVAK